MATIAMSSSHTMDSSAVEMARMVGVPGLASDEEEDDDVESLATGNLARPHRARRLQSAIRDIVREHYLCFVLVWLLLVLALAIATFVTFIELLIVFRRHYDDPCDVPLDVFIWINIVTFVYHNTMHLCIQRWLGYDPTMYNSDEPIPEAVARYEAFVQFWSFLLCIAGVVLVCEAKTCSDTAPELFGATARFAWVGFALAIACIATSLSTAIFVVLMRSGALTTSNAAPTGTLNVCRVVQTDKPSPEDEELLAPDQDGEAQTCPICMEIFGPDKEVRLTPCKHLFHGPCLAGWLNVSRCCPMCRHDFTQAPPPASTTAASTRPSAAARTSASASSQIEPQSQGGQADPLVPFSSAHFNAEQTSDNSRSGAADSGEESGSSAPNNNPAQSPPGGATPLSATSPRSERKEADNSPTRRRSPRSRDSGGGGTGSSRSPKNRRSPPPRNQRPNNNNEATTSGSGSATPTSTLANIRRLPSPTSENSSNFGSSSSYSSSSTSTSSSSDSSVVGAPQAVESSSSSAAEDNQADVPSPEEQALSGAGTHIGGL